MIKEAIGTGETIEEAKEQAIANLNAGIDEEIEFEVLATPRKKTLGLFGGSPAKVRVYVEVPDPVQPKARPARQEAPGQRPAKPKPEAPKQASPAQKPAPARQQEKPVREPSARKEQQKAAPPPAQVQQKPVQAPSQETPAAPAAPGVPVDQVPADSPAGRAAAYLNKIFHSMDLNAVSMEVSEIEGGSQISLTGEGLGVIIGRRGETLDALQYLASLAANSSEGGYYRIVLNTGNYREKREHTLEALARRMAAQVVKTGRSRSLEPMNPYERRIIHTTVQNIAGVVSNSVGDGADRRVVISPVRENNRGRDIRPDRPGQRGGRPGFRNQPSSSSAPSGAMRETKQDVSDTPLYGRIDKTEK